MKLRYVLVLSLLDTVFAHAADQYAINMRNDGDTSVSICADTLAFGRCPVVEPMKDFNISRVYGQWYFSGDYTDPRFRGQKCIKRLFSNGDVDSGGDMKNRCRTNVLAEWTDDVTGENHQMHSWIVAPDVNDKMHMVHTMEMGAPMRWYPLATDYETYMATYACVEFPPDCPVAHRIYAGICSRSTEFSRETYRETLKAYAKFGIASDKFRYMDNSNCEPIAKTSGDM